MILTRRSPQNVLSSPLGEGFPAASWPVGPSPRRRTADCRVRDQSAGTEVERRAVNEADVPSLTAPQPRANVNEYYTKIFQILILCTNTVVGGRRYYTVTDTAYMHVRAVTQRRVLRILGGRMATDGNHFIEISTVTYPICTKF